MKKMKILHVIDKLSVDGSKIHGPGRQISYRVPYYDSDRFEIVVCNLKTDDVSSEFLRKKGLRVICLSRSKFSPLTIYDLYRLISIENPSLLHLHGYASWNFGRIAAKIANVPIVLQEHFVDEKIALYQKFADFILRPFNGRGLAVSESVKDFMVNCRHVERNDIKVIWNGIPVDDFESKSGNILKTKLGIEPNTKVVGIVGRLAEMKGHKYFLLAAKYILQKMDNTVFIIVGEGPLKNDLKSLAAELKIDRKVFFVGYQEDVSAYLSLFDVNVVASIFGEGFCSVGIESFAAGTPVVITDLPCFKDIYINKINVLMVPIRDQLAMANAILDLLQNKSFGIDLVRNADKTLDKFHIKNIASIYENFYEEILFRLSKTHQVKDR
jgi:glycosyltransferase involved in cell wall biosynthesis